MSHGTMETTGDALLEEVIEAQPFWKMSGSGNDFIVVHNRNAHLPEALKGEWSRRVCRAHVSGRKPGSRDS